MTLDEVKEIAEHSGWPQSLVAPIVLGKLAEFARAVAAREREACAAVCDVTPPHPFRPSIEAAHAIRART